MTIQKEVLLGRVFLKNNEALINWKNYTVTIQSHSINFVKRTDDCATKTNGGSNGSPEKENGDPSNRVTPIDSTSTTYPVSSQDIINETPSISCTSITVYQLYFCTEIGNKI